MQGHHPVVVELRPEGSEIKDDEVLADGLIHVATSPSVSEVSSMTSSSSE